MGSDCYDGRALRYDCLRNEPLLTYGGNRTESIPSSNRKLVTMQTS